MGQSKRLIILNLSILIIVDIVTSNYVYPTVYQNKTFLSNQFYNFPESKLNQTCKTVADKVPVYNLCHRSQIEYENFTFDSTEDVCNLHGTNGNYDLDVNLPWKFVVYNNNLYFNVKRVLGAYSTLNYFPMSGINKENECPLAKPYPSNANNILASPECAASEYYLTNVHDFDIDRCGVLWALDVGSYSNTSNSEAIFVKSPSIYVFNTSAIVDDQLKKVIEIPEKYYTKQDVLGFSTILVNTKQGCCNSFVYIFNARSGLLLVYSSKSDSFWGLKSIYFKPEPFFSYFNFLLSDYMYSKYVVHDGVSAVLDDYGILYSTLAGKNLYHISFTVVNDPASETRKELSYQIVNRGKLNYKGQLGGLVGLNNQYFAVQELNHALVCFSGKPKIQPETIQFVVEDLKKYDFISDLYLYSDNVGCQRVYFLDNNLIEIQKYGLDVKRKNIQFFYIDLKEALTSYPECTWNKEYVQSLPHVSKSPCQLQESTYSHCPYNHPQNYQPSIQQIHQYNY